MIDKITEEIVQKIPRFLMDYPVSPMDLTKLGFHEDQKNLIMSTINKKKGGIIINSVSLKSSPRKWGCF